MFKQKKREPLTLDEVENRLLDFVDSLARSQDLIPVRYTVQQLGDNDRLQPVRRYGLAQGFFRHEEKEIYGK